MQQQEEKKFQALREMFNSEGWKIFQEEIKTSLEQSIGSAADMCIDEATWQFRRGEIFKLRQFAGYQAYIEAVESQVEEEDASL